jgi:DNA-binding NarL/FixJ family response regulator
MTLRVLLADDHPVVRDGLRALVSTAADMTVVAEAGDGREAIRLARAHGPDAIIMDLAMPALDGAAATREILAVRPATGIVILTMHTDDTALAAALQAGALGFLAKDSVGQDVLDAVRAVAGGKAYFAASVATRVLRLAGAGVRAMSAEALPALTTRERQILLLITEGLDNDTIASRLVISRLTVRNHLTNILTKLGVSNRQAAAEVARKAGIHPARAARVGEHRTEPLGQLGPSERRRL